MVRSVDGWVTALVRGCLDGMSQLRDDELQTWLEADVRELGQLLCANGS